jgi:hypothetical protein
MKLELVRRDIEALRDMARSDSQNVRALAGIAEIREPR